MAFGRLAPIEAADVNGLALATFAREDQASRVRFTDFTYLLCQ